MNEGKAKSKRSILFALVFIISLAVVATSAAFTVLLVHYRTRDLIERQDAGLFTAAELMQEMLGPGYHDRIIDEKSVSKEEFNSIVARNDELCRRLKLQYLWSVLVLRDRIVFTSATHSVLNDPKSPCASFFETHRDPQSFATALQPGLKPAFSSFRNEWGQGRQVLIPRKDAQGRTYIFGASVQLTELDATVRRTALVSIGIGLAIVCGAILLALKLAYSFSLPITRLTRAAGRMASGDFDVPLEPVSTREVQSLSESLDQMRQATRQQLSDLQKSEALLRATLGATADGILVVDKEGRISHANDQFARMWGIPQDILDAGDDELVLGFALDSLVDPEGFLSKVRELYQSSREDLDEILFKDGRVFERFSCPVVRDGEEVGRIWDFRDITERKLVEEELRISGQRLRRSQEIGHVASWEYDLKTGKVWGSEEGFRMYGIVPYTGELPVDRVEACIPERGMVHQALVDLIGQGKKYDLEYAINPEGDGPQRIITSIAELERDGQGNPVRVSGVIQDVTARRKAEDALRRSEERYRSMVESQTEFISRFRPDGTFVYMNEVYQRYFEKTEEELLGHAWTPAAHPDDLVMIKAGLSRMSPANPVVTIENRVISGTGDSRWVQFVNQGFYDSEGILVEIQSVGRDITERKLAELALRKSERRMNDIIEFLPDATLAIDSDGRIIVWNKAIERMTGIPARDMLGKGDHEHTIPFYGERRSQLMDLIWVEDEKITRMYPYVHREGEALISEAFCNALYQGRGAQVYAIAGPLHDQDGNVVGAIESIRDITEIRRAEEQLIKSEEKFSKAFQASPAAVSIASLVDGRYLEINDLFIETTGFERSEVVGHTSTELGVWVDADERARYIEELTGNGFLRDFETRYRMKDGEVRSFSMSSDIIQLDGETFSLNFFTDITERKRAEEELRKLASAIEQAAECVVIADLHGNIQYVNPAFERITGYGRDEAVGQNPRILKSGEQDEAFYKTLWDSITRGDTWSGKLVNRRKDGTRYTEEATISPIRDKTGSIVSFVAVKRDITKEVELEAQLLHSQKLEAVGQLAGGVAHDLNNLLTPILGYSEILLEDLREGDPRRGDILQIQQAAESAKTLTRQLLAFSRRQVLEMKPVDLGKVLTNFRKILRRTIREDISIRVQLASSVGLVRADVGQIEQIIMNLAVNAQDAMPAGGILTLAARDLAPDDALPGPYVLLEVSDTGKGMDGDLLAHIFEPFFTTKDKSKGTGLGLSTVYGIVKQHAGFIDVSSEPGTGATFRICLPRLQDGGEIQETQGSPREQDEAGGDETVLIVEDNGQVRDLVGSILRKLGYVVISAGDGKECLDVMAAYVDHIDLLLTDVVMPDMNGRELYDRLSQSRPGLPVIFMSGYTDDAISRHGVLDTGVELIHKPFTRNSLAKKVREVLDRKGGGEAR